MHTPSARPPRLAARRLAPLLGALLLAACGSSTKDPAVAVGGSVFAGPVSGASVVARDAAGAAVCAAVTTAADGSFTLSIPQSRLAAPLLLEATGGTFTDEATGAVTTGVDLAVHLPAGSVTAASRLHLTPQSTIVARMIQHGKTLAEANAAFEAAFGFVPDPAVAPANAPPVGGALGPAQAALRAGAFSQLAHDLGFTAAQQFELVHVLAHDALDGALDGLDDGVQLSLDGHPIPADVQNRFAAALLAWRGAAGNLTGLDEGQIGEPPFARVALTASYRVEYLADAAPVAGQSRFQVKVTDPATGAGVPGLAPVLMPMMHMPGMGHATPVDAVVDEGGGVYGCAAYYLMMSGPGMGYWRLDVVLGGMGGETATFYPRVGMAMGALVRLAGPAGTADLVPGMPTAAKRTYLLFSEGLTVNAVDGTFKLLIATMDTMMSFPHVAPGATLQNASGPVTVDTIAVEVSTDGAAWAPAVHLADGHWSASGLSGLTAGTAASLQVRLTVNGERKLTQDGSADHATFPAMPVAEGTVAVTGSVFAAPVSGAQVVARTADGAAACAPATTGADGTFTLAVPRSKAGAALVLEATGGTFTDEATGAATAGGTLRVHLPAGSVAAGGARHLTPQSTIVARLVADGLSPTAAGAAFLAAFGFTPDPAVAPANAPVVGADLAPAQAALRAGAFSALAEALGVPAAAQFDLFQALAVDLEDGALDGQAAGAPLVVAGVTLPVDLQNRFATALMAWRTDAANLTALKVDQIGAPPFAKRALTASYQVEYLPGALAAAVGKTRFQVRVTDRTTGAPVTGLAVGLMPKMHMSTKSHATATDPVVEAGAGVYDATIYYVMETASAMGMSMGVWELGVVVGGETATFYPQVAPATNQIVRLIGTAADSILLATGPAKRTYQLFNDGVAMDGEGTAAFGLLITTMDTMMTFPHVFTGATLLKPSDAVPPVPVAFAVGAVLVEVSSDGGTSWTPATHAGDGHYTAAGLPGFTAGAPTTLRVRLTVAGEVKTTQDLSAAYATFTVTPAAP